MPDTPPRSFRLRALALLLVACFVAALPALGGGLLSYDDENLLLGPEGALERDPGSFFTRTYYYAYLPFYGLSYWVDGQLGASAEHPLLFHLGNVLWHAATCFLVFWVLTILLEHPLGALFGALLFAVHPLHVESVAWIAGRKELVSGFFFFLAWLLFLRSERGGGGALAGALACFLVACFAKSTAVVLPLLLLAAALLLPRYARRRRSAALATLPFFLAALVPVVVHLGVGVEQGVIVEKEGIGARLLYLVAGWGGSIRRTLLPLDFAIDYPEVRGAGPTALVWPGVLLFASLAALVAFARRLPALAFGLAAFFAALLPFNNVFPATDVLAADRYLYLPLFGLAVAVAWAVRRGQHRAAVAFGFVAVACTALSFVSAGRFVSDEELWTRTIAARDDSALAWINRGLTRVNRARASVPRDRELLRTGVEDLRHGLARAALAEHKAKAGLGMVIPLAELGEAREAVERASDALALVEGLEGAEAERFRASVLYDRGAVYKEAFGDHAAAARDFHESARLWPRYAAWLEAGGASLRCGRVSEARVALERAGELDRSRPEPFLDLSQLYRLTDRPAERHRALEEARRRAANDPAVVAAWVEFRLEGKAPDYRRAAEELEKLPPESVERTRLAAAVEAQRALFLFRRGELEQAIEAAEQARDGGLRDQASLYELGQIYLEAGRYDDAVACYREATDLLDARDSHRDAIARAYALKAYQRLVAGDREGARGAMRAALGAEPELIEAGAAPLRGECAGLRQAGDADLLLLAAAAVAGDPVRGARLAADLLDRDLGDADRVAVYRLRALLRAFTPPMDFKGAEDDLRQVLARDEGDLWARFRLAQVWTRAGVGWLGTARQLGSESREAEGRALLERAIELLGGILEEQPDFHYARLQRGEARFALDDLSGAKADYQALRDRGAEIKESPLKEAVLHRLAYVRAGDATNLDVAEQLLARALDADPNYFDALFELGNVHHLRYDRQDDPGRLRTAAFNRAIFWYRRAMALNPRQREPRVEWARIVLKAAREAMAANEIRRADQLIARVEQEAPDVVEAHKERLQVCLRPEYGARTGTGPNRIFEQADAALAAVERLAPSDPELPALRALCHRRKGFSFYWRWVQLQRQEGHEAERERARELAVEQWRAAIAAWPQDPENEALRDRLRELAPGVIVFDEQRAREAFERGRAAFDRQEWEQAAAHFRQAVGLFPESSDLRHSLAMALARAGQLEEAKSEFERVANSADGERFPEALYELGNIYLVRKERLVARIWYERYLKAMERLDRGDDPLVERARQLIEELGR